MFLRNRHITRPYTTVHHHQFDTILIHLRIKQSLHIAIDILFYGIEIMTKKEGERELMRMKRCCLQLPFPANRRIYEISIDFCSFHVFDSFIALSVF